MMSLFIEAHYRCLLIWSVCDCSPSALMMASFSGCRKDTIVSDFQSFSYVTVNRPPPKSPECRCPLKMPCRWIRGAADIAACNPLKCVYGGCYATVCRHWGMTEHRTLFCTLPPDRSSLGNLDHPGWSQILESSWLAWVWRSTEKLVFTLQSCMFPCPLEYNSSHVSMNFYKFYFILFLPRDFLVLFK